MEALIIDDKFVKKYDKVIYKAIRRMKIHPRAVEEIHFLVYERLMKHNNYNPDKAKVTTWLNLIVRSVVSNSTRKLRDSMDVHDRPDVREVKGEDILDEGVTDIATQTHVIGDEDAGTARDELNRVIKASVLSKRDKQLVEDVFIQGYTQNEAAEVHSMTREAVGKALSRAMKVMEAVAQQSQGEVN